MLLDQLVETFDEDKVLAELMEMAEHLATLEAVTIEPIESDASYDELLNLMGDAILRFEAARKGLGITSKLRDPVERTKHRSAIMSNLNKLRGLTARIDKAISNITNETNETR